MRKLFRTAFAISLLFAGLWGNSQQPVLAVKSFDYIWKKDVEDMTGTGERVVMPFDDSVKLLLKNTFAKAIQERWNVVMPGGVLLSVKKLPIFAYEPKFNTRIKDEEAGKWYLFLQVFDKGKFTNFSDDAGPFYYGFDLKCRLVNGSNDSVIADRALTVQIYTEPVPPGEVQLTRLPAFPTFFAEAFDSMATWLFQPVVAGEKKLRLKPACVFEQREVKDTVLGQLVFKSDHKSIQQLTVPAFTFINAAPAYKRTGAKRHTGGNSAVGALTLLTGLGTSKSRVFSYSADFPFEEADSTYHCLIAYAEKQTAERERTRNDDGSYSMNSSGYTLLARYTNPSSQHAVTLGADTIATFSIRYTNDIIARANYHQMWDGSDSATIRELPAEWNNTTEATDVVLSGKMGNDSFTMHTSKETRIKSFYMNDQMVVTMQGMDEPASAWVFHPVSTQQLKLFTILASLPYAYFNERYGD